MPLLFGPDGIQRGAYSHIANVALTDCSPCALPQQALFNNVISDYFWAHAVLLTSPLIATLGLSLTIPLVGHLAQHLRVHSALFTHALTQRAFQLVDHMQVHSAPFSAALFYSPSAAVPLCSLTPALKMCTDV